MGVYRVHKTSTWSSKTQKEFEKLWIPFLENIIPNFDNEVQGVLKEQITFFEKLAQKKRTLTFIKIKSKIIQMVKRMI